MKNPMGNMGNLLKQAQAMQAQMAKVIHNSPPQSLRLRPVALRLIARSRWRLRSRSQLFH